MDYDDDLAEFFETIADIRNRNYGGCLYFCYAFWLWLIARNMPTDSFDIMQYDDLYAGNNISLNLLWIENQTGSAVSSHHFAWMYKGKLYDAEGLVNPEEFELYENTLLNLSDTMIDKFCKSALNNVGWNECFDREYATMILEDNLGIDMSSVT